MRISDWSSDVCSSDLLAARRREFVALAPVRPILVVKRDGDLLERQPAVLDREPAAQAPARIGLVAEEEFHGVSGFPSRLREGVGEGLFRPGIPSTCPPPTPPASGRGD